MEDARTEVVSEKYTDDENSDAFSEFQGAILWPRRSLLYRVSFLAILPLFAIFLMGFISPFWMKKHQVDKYRGYYNFREKVDVSIGLWRVCEGTDYSDITDCTVIPDVTPYFVVCQSMLCLSLIFTVFSLIFGLYENCATRYDIEEGNEVRTKRPEMNAVMAGLFGLTGVCMYGTSIIEAARNDEGAVHWAFPVTAASVTGVIVCGILMAIANPIHTATPSYPGQIMNLSRQNSLRVRESNIQDRLVITSESVAQASSSQASGTMYGVTGSNFEDKDVPFLQRSESCLSSHMSSPDIFTATSQDPGFTHSYRSTHVVEPHDIHSRAYDHARRQAFKQQLQNKAAQRRSWHFDDRSGAYIVTDLINNRPCDSLPSQARPLRDADGVKPPVPPRRDKLTSPANSKRQFVNDHVLTTHNDTTDLMVLNDPVVTAPGKLEQSTNNVAKPDEMAVTKRNTNPFIEDTAIVPSHTLSDLQHSTVSNGSWESQSWPDPPSECDMLGQTVPTVPNTNNTRSDRSDSNSQMSQIKSVPESLQYQPQNYTNHPRKHDQGEGSNITYSTLKSNDTHVKPSKGNHPDLSHRHRKSAGKNTPPPLEAQVPIMKEYDNPLFKSQPPDGERVLTLGDNFILQICESTSFVHPSPEQPPSSSFYTAVGINKSETTSSKRHSSHHSCSPILENRECAERTSPRLSQDKIRDTAPPAYSRFNNRRPEDTQKKHVALKDKSRSSNKQQQQNGVIKSRPRQVKREHQQRRNGHPDGGNLQQQQPSSPHTGRYGSSPDLTNKSPRVGRRRPDSVGPGNEAVYGQADYNRNMSGRTKSSEHNAGTHGYDISRQPQIQAQYYSKQPGQYRHWGDSDL